MSRPFIFILDDNRTSTLAATEPDWGAKYNLGEPGQFSHAQWHAIASLLLALVARHPARTLDVSQATVCVAAAPSCKKGNRGVVRRRREAWQRRCPGRPMCDLAPHTSTHLGLSRAFSLL